MNPNLVRGTIFTAKFPVFTGSFRNPKFSHEVTVKGKILKESYSARGQHTFTFEVLESSDVQEFAIGCKYRKMGRNIYPNLLCVEQPANYEELAKEKRLRKDKVEQEKQKIKEMKEKMIEELISKGISVNAAYAIANERLY